MLTADAGGAGGGVDGEDEVELIGGSLGGGEDMPVKIWEPPESPPGVPSVAAEVRHPKSEMFLSSVFLFSRSP